MAHRLTHSERRATLSLSKKHRVVALRSSLFPDQTLYHVHPRSKKRYSGRFTLGEGAYQTQDTFDGLEEALHHMGLADAVKREQGGMCGWFVRRAGAAVAATAGAVGSAVVSGARGYTRLFAHPAGRLLIVGMGSAAAAGADKKGSLALAPPGSLLEVGAATRLPEGMMYDVLSREAARMAQDQTTFEGGERASDDPVPYVESIHEGRDEDIPAPFDSNTATPFLRGGCDDPSLLELLAEGDGLTYSGPITRSRTGCENRKKHLKSLPTPEEITQNRRKKRQQESKRKRIAKIENTRRNWFLETELYNPMSRIVPDDKALVFSFFKETLEKLPTPVAKKVALQRYLTSSVSPKEKVYLRTLLSDEAKKIFDQMECAKFGPLLVKYKDGVPIWRRDEGGRYFYTEEGVDKVAPVATPNNKISKIYVVLDGLERLQGGQEDIFKWCVDPEYLPRQHRHLIPKLTIADYTTKFNVILESRRASAEVTGEVNTAYTFFQWTTAFCFNERPIPEPELYSIENKERLIAQTRLLRMLEGGNNNVVRASMRFILSDGTVGDPVEVIPEDFDLWKSSAAHRPPFRGCDCEAYKADLLDIHAVAGGELGPVCGEYCKILRGKSPGGAFSHTEQGVLHFLKIDAYGESKLLHQVINSALRKKHAAAGYFPPDILCPSIQSTVLNLNILSYLTGCRMCTGTLHMEERAGELFAGVYNAYLEALYDKHCSSAHGPYRRMKFTADMAAIEYQGQNAHITIKELDESLKKDDQRVYMAINNLECKREGVVCPAGKVCLPSLDKFHPKVPQKLFIGWYGDDGQSSLKYSLPAQEINAGFLQ